MHSSTSPNQGETRPGLRHSSGWGPSQGRLPRNGAARPCNPCPGPPRTLPPGRTLRRSCARFGGSDRDAARRRVLTEVEEYTRGSAQNPMTDAEPRENFDPIGRWRTNDQLGPLSSRQSCRRNRCRRIRACGSRRCILPVVDNRRRWSALRLVAAWREATVGRSGRAVARVQAGALSSAMARDVSLRIVRCLPRPWRVARQPVEASQLAQAGVGL